MCSIINIIIFVIISAILSFYDCKYYHIPLIPLYLGLLVSIIITFFMNRYVLLNNLLGMISMSLFFLLMRLITKGGIGYGDIQYALYCGFIASFPYFIFVSLAAAIFGILIYLFIKKKEKRIPFVIAMMLGTISGWIFSFLK